MEGNEGAGSFSGVYVLNAIVTAEVCPGHLTEALCVKSSTVKFFFPHYMPCCSCFFLFCFDVYLFYLKGKVCVLQRSLPSADLFPKRLLAGLGHTNARSQELLVGVPERCQGPRYLGHPLSASYSRFISIQLERKGG